jgi:uncharacterized small protein (DUF1192 family)
VLTLLVVLAVAWVVVVGGALLFVGVRGWRLFRRVRAVQAELESRVSALQEGGVASLERRTALLQERQARLQAAVADLQVSLAGARVLLAAWSDARSGVDAVRRYLHP